MVDHVFISSSPWWESMEQIWTNNMGTRSHDCVGHATWSKPSKILLDLEENTRNQKGVSVPVATRSKGYQLGMRTPRRSQRDLVLFFGWFFFSENRFGLGVFLGNQLCELWNFFIYISREISVYIVLCQVYGTSPWSNTPALCFQNLANWKLPKLLQRRSDTHTQQKDPLARTGIALCWHKLIHF